jgi:sorbitol-specific phosphotransferase system component IIBC
MGVMVQAVKNIAEKCVSVVGVIYDAGKKLVNKVIDTGKECINFTKTIIGVAAGAGRDILQALISKGNKIGVASYAGYFCKAIQ